jgi:S-adenosylmethionine hydrolase
MKGVMLAKSQRLALVDLSHAIEPHQVGDAAFWLALAFGWFPTGTVHLAVVDPGVGTDRAAVVAQAGGHWFVAPDNGLLEVVARRTPGFEARAIDVERLKLRPPSRTFHGRDLFAPVAAMLAARDLRFDSVGPPHALLSTKNVPEPELMAADARGRVVVVDHFGNLVTNLVRGDLPQQSGLRVKVEGRELPLVGTYADVAPGELGALTGSFGEVELFVRNGSAARVLSAQRGTPVTVAW